MPKQGVFFNSNAYLFAFVPGIFVCFGFIWESLLFSRQLKAFPLAIYSCPVNEFAVSLMLIVFLKAQTSSNVTCFGNVDTALERLIRVLFELSFMTIMLEPVIVKALPALPPVRKRQVISCAVRSVLDERRGFLPASRVAVCVVVLYGTSAFVVNTAACAVVEYAVRLVVVASCVEFQISPPARLLVSVLAVLPESFRMSCVY